MRHHTRLLIGRIVATDTVALVAAFLTAYWVRDRFLAEAWWAQGPLVEFSQYLWLLPVIIPTWLGLFASFKLYQPARCTSFRHTAGDIVKVTAIGLTLLMGCAYALKLQDTSRSFLVLFGLLSGLCILAGRLAHRYKLRRDAERRYTLSNILIVGTGEKAQALAGLIDSKRRAGFHLLGLISENRYGRYAKQAGSYPVIGNLCDLEHICKTRVVDEVIFVVPGKILSDMEDLFLLCEELGVNARIAVGLFPHLIAKATLEEFHEIPLLTFTTKPMNWPALAVKRAIDLSIAWTAILAGLPLWVLIAVAIKLDSPGPILFCQERCGLNGRRFTMYKFRSMVWDAEARREELTSSNELKGPVFKIRRDPRMTGVGKFLRRTSLDEIPQLLNVIRGDMSVVGPRPAIPAEVDKYERWQRRRLSMKPGLTSLWVVSGRNEVPFQQWMQLDLEYIDHWSLASDGKILLKTLPMIVSGRGAS